MHASYFAMKSSQTGIPILSPSFATLVGGAPAGAELPTALLLLDEAGVAELLELLAVPQASSSKIDDMQKTKRIFLVMFPPVAWIERGLLDRDHSTRRAREWCKAAQSPFTGNLIAHLDGRNISPRAFRYQVQTGLH